MKCLDVDMCCAVWAGVTVSCAMDMRDNSDGAEDRRARYHVNTCYVEAKDEEAIYE